jgi:hypothetical protein
MRGLQKLLVPAAAIVMIALAGCDIMVLDEWNEFDDEVEHTSDPSLFAVTAPSAGALYRTGDRVSVRWNGTAQPDYITIDLFRSGEKLARIGQATSYGGEYIWIIPTDLDTATEVSDEYKIVASGFHPDYPDDLLLVAYSDFFEIEPESSSGLSDVTVNSRTIDITLIDDGSAIDGDTIAIYLNGALIVDNHVLVDAPGTTFSLLLQPGNNTLEVYAINEGSVSPNTALLQISNVIAGQSVQQWRLASGDWGSLTITAP